MAAISEEKTSSHAFDLAPPDRARAVVFWDGGSDARDLAPGRDLLVGRGEDCDLQVLHRTVSRKHARLRTGTPVTLEDLGSDNGTYIDGLRLPRGPQPLATGQVAQLGTAMLVLQGDFGAAVTATSAPAPDATETA